jgi:hypothetical protein
LPCHIPREVTDVYSSALGRTSDLGSGSRGILLSVLSEEEGSASKVHIGQSVDGILSIRNGGKLNNGTTSRSSICIPKDSAGDHRTSLRHVLIELIIGHRPGKIAYKYSSVLKFSSVHNLAK